MWNSDIDLVVETIEEISSTDGLVQLADLVRGKAWAEYVDEILDARVPIIKISTTHEFGMGIFYILLKVDEFVFCPRIIES
jgi:DNA polymerase sigma